MNGDYMKVGDTVFQEYQGILRFGLVGDITQKSGWSYAKIKWFDDEAYERAMADLAKLRNGEINDYALEKYRVDTIKVVDLDKQINRLNKIKKFKRNRS